MNPDKWKAANEIFHAALDLPASERDSYVSITSAGDSEVELEVRRLLKADSEAGSYLETPAVPISNAELSDSTPIPFQPGDVLKHRFKIICHVGQGGMGHVFEAFDLDLKVRIALKAIRPEIAANPAALEYFRREVRTARTITHANICRTFDFDKGSITDGSVSDKQYFFLTMEFLAGETLSDRIRRDGRLPTANALDLARQIASGLDSAHAVGIIHRDIKPANIMLVPAPEYGKPPRAVIMDFGLARRDPLGPTIEGSAMSHGAIVGTLAYMAPEQLDPDEKVSPATDIYSFGLVLFEMATGQRAFPSANLLSGIAQRLNGPPPSPLTLAPDLTRQWEAAIQGCLRIDPAQRFQAASQAIQVLDGVGSALPPKLPPAQLVQQVKAPRPRNILAYAAAAILVLALSLSALWLRLHRQEENSKVVPGALVFLTPVKNQTGDKALDNLTELLQAGLSQSAQINLLDQSRVGDTLQLMTKPPDTVIDEPTAREIALRTGAVRVVFATVTGSAASYSLNIDIQQPDATSPARPRDQWRKSFNWSPSSSTANSTTIPPQLLNAVRNSTDWIRYEVGESRNDIARLDAPPEDVTTSNWQALQDYNNAENFYQQGKKEQAIAALNQAVTLDSHFALAYARIGDLDVSIGQTQEGYRAYLRALNTDQDRRLTRRELDRIRGIFASDSWDYQAAESAFHDYTIYYENDSTGWFFRALPLMRLGRTVEAIETLKRAYQLDPRRASAAYDLATCFIELGDHTETQHWIDVIKQLRQFELAAQLDGILAFLDGQPDSAETSFLSMRSSPLPIFRLRAYSYLTRLEAEQGNYTRALAWASSGSAEAEADGNNAQRAAFLMDQANIHCHLGQFQPCLEQAKKALDLDASPELLISASELYGQTIPKAPAAFSLRFREALTNLTRLMPHDIQNAAYALASLRINTELLLADGKIDAALSDALKAAAIDTQFRRRELLARTLTAAARMEKDANRRNSQLEQAREALALTATDPPAVWVQPSLYQPGALARDAADYLQVAREGAVAESTLQKALEITKRMNLSAQPRR